MNFIDDVSVGFDFECSGLSDVILVLNVLMA